ncbi:MAG: phosphotransferase family protein [Steroidobacteraceae bacterium]
MDCRTTTGPQPDTYTILNAVRREVAFTLMPELSSDRARTIATFIDEVLRHLMTRSTIMPELLHRKTAELCDVLSALGGTVDPCPRAESSEQLADLDTALSHALEPLIAQRASAACATTGELSDSICNRAIAAELACIQAETGHEAAQQHRVFADPERYAVTAEKVERYLARAWPDREALRVTHCVRVLGGFSKDTYLVECSWRGGQQGLAIRRDNPYGSVDSTAAGEFSMLRDLTRLGMPVPPPLLLEEDSTTLGFPFFVSRKMPGAPVPNTVSMQVGAAQREAACGLARVLAQLHSLDVDRLEPQSALRIDVAPSGYFEYSIDRLERAWQAHQLTPSPTITSAFAWMRAHVPTFEGHLRLVHGDAGLHNLLMNGAEIGAMLDWEFAHLGEPVEDLVYARMWIDQIMPWAEFLQHYHEHGGPKFSDLHADFYSVFYSVRHVMNTSKGMKGFIASPQPELNCLVGGLRYGRHFLGEVARAITRPPEQP